MFEIINKLFLLLSKLKVKLMECTNYFKPLLFKIILKFTLYNPYLKNPMSIKA